MTESVRESERVTESVRESERVTERVREREREKTSKTRGDYASLIREHCYVSESIETIYSNFDC